MKDPTRKKPDEKNSREPKKKEPNRRSPTYRRVGKDESKDPQPLRSCRLEKTQYLPHARSILWYFRPAMVQQGPQGVFVLNICIFQGTTARSGAPHNSDEDSEIIRAVMVRQLASHDLQTYCSECEYITVRSHKGVTAVIPRERRNKLRCHPPYRSSEE